MEKIKICIDAGHYGKYNQSPANKTYYESDMNWKLHLLLKYHLEQYGIEVITTRENQATDKALYNRGVISKGCDLFISLHSNAVGNYVDESIDYPLAYVQLDGAADVLGQQLADCIADVMGTKQSGQIQKRRSEKTGGEYYGVIRGAVVVGTMGMILEHSFHTNTRSTNWLLKDENLDQLAIEEADIIATYFGVAKQDTSVDPVMYRVQCGAFKNKSNAEDSLERVKDDGFTDAFITWKDGFYKVQVGAYGKKSNADKMLVKLQEKGYDAFITT